MCDEFLARHRGGSAACLFTSVTWIAFAITIGVAVVAARRTLTPPY
jgi:hypothetical protein